MARVLYYVLWLSVLLFTYRRPANAQVFVKNSLTFPNEKIPSTEALNLNFTWYFETYDGSQLHLSFKNLALRKYLDFILVGERSQLGVKRQILRWYGNDNSNQLSVLTPGNNLWLTLQSHQPNLIKTFSGFIQVVNSSSPEYEKHCSSGFDCGNGACITMNDICNGIVNCDNHADEQCRENITVNSTVKEIKSMNYPEAYLPDCQYTWYFTTQEDSHLQLTFENITTEELHDRVTVGEGDDASRGQLLSLSGSPDVNSIKVISSGSQMWVRFSSDETDQRAGIAGSVQRVKAHEDKSVWECSDGVQVCPGLCLNAELNCTGNADCQQNCTNFCDVHETKCSHESVCYNSSQTCDGTPDCSLSDDETNCIYHIKDKYKTFKFSNFEGMMRFTTVDGYRLSLSFEVFQREHINHHISVGEGNDTSSHLLDITSDTDIGRIFNVMSASNALWMNFETKNGFFCSVRAINQSTAATIEQPSLPVCPANIIVTMEKNEISTIFTPPTCTDKWEGVLFTTCSHAPDHYFGKGETEVVCSCANSAGLSSNCTFIVSVTREPTAQKRSLDVITMIGLIICIIGLIFCIFTFLLVRTFRTNKPLQIQANLYVSLCALYLVLVVAIRKTDNGLTCKINAVLINVFVLSTISWISVDAYLLFLCYLRRVETYPKHLLLKAVCFSWGLPVSEIVLVFIFDKFINPDQTSTFCFLHPRYGISEWILVTSILHLVFNCVVLGSLAFKMYSSNFSPDGEDDRKRAFARIRNAIYSRFLLALAFLFGVLAMNISSLRILFEFLCVFCMTFQVIIMFRIMLIQTSDHRKVFTIFKSALPSPRTTYKIKKLRNRRPSPPSFLLVEMNDNFENGTDENVT